MGKLLLHLKRTSFLHVTINIILILILKLKYYSTVCSCAPVFPGNLEDPLVFPIISQVSKLKHTSGFRANNLTVTFV